MNQNFDLDEFKMSQIHDNQNSVLKVSRDVIVANKRAADVEQPSAKVSRRHLVTGTVLFGSLVVASLTGAGDAVAERGRAGRRRRIRRWVRQRRQKFRDKYRDKYHPVCYLRGTRIRTPDGEVAIEDLRIGDPVITVSGGVAPVKWLGRMRLERGRSGAWERPQRPIKIARGAIDGCLPCRDLYVSAAHHIYLDNVLIPAKDLVNGISITEFDATNHDVLEYYQVELAKHDVIFADGIAAETFLANATSRKKFDNYDEFVRLYGESTISMAPCAPILAYFGGRGNLLSLWRSAVAPIYDRRDARDIARDRIVNLALQRGRELTTEATRISH